MTEDSSEFFEEEELLFIKEEPEDEPEDDDLLEIKEEPEMDIMDTYEIDLETNAELNALLKRSSSPIQECVQSHNTGKTLYECHICGKRLTHKRSLNNHMLGHTNDMPVKCPYCPKTFATQSALAGHRRTHTGEKP